MNVLLTVLVIIFCKFVNNNILNYVHIEEKLYYIRLCLKLYPSVLVRHSIFIVHRHKIRMKLHIRALGLSFWMQSYSLFDNTTILYQIISIDERDDLMFHDIVCCSRSCREGLSQVRWRSQLVTNTNRSLLLEER